MTDTSKMVFVASLIPTLRVGMSRLRSDGDHRSEKKRARFVDNPSTSAYIALHKEWQCSPFFSMNIAVFASGRGSNFEAILNAIHRGELPARVSLLISNKSEAGALELARSNNIPAVHLSPIHFPDEDSYVDRLLGILREHTVDIIALAGYLKKIPVRVIRQYRNKIVNIHPALLPKFGGSGMYGVHVHEAVIAAGERQSGASVHIVDEEYDRGAILMQQSVNVDVSETPESLAAKVLTVEHSIYPRVLRAFAEGRIHVDGDRVWMQLP
jgi:phosphoribosylglycinamide formyltransferase-1